MHVELEYFLQKIGRYNLRLQFASGARLICCLFRLLFQFDAFESQEILGALDWIFERSIGVIEHGTLFQTPRPFLLFSLSEYVGMELAAECVKFFFQCGSIQIQLAGKCKKGEVVDWNRRLHFSTRIAEVQGAHGATR